MIPQAMVHGEGRKFLSALLVPDSAARDRLGPAELAMAIRTAVDQVNLGVSRTEQIKAFVILDHELTVEADEITPTHKLRRTVIAERYRDRLEALDR